MTDLITWLRAQLDEDERAAHAWLPFGNPTDPDREHIARHDPMRVLADVDVKRRILDDCAGTLENEDYGLWLAGQVIRQLAVTYSEREGYRDEWRP